MNIYLIGIGGIAMGNLAYMLKTQGHNVSGSDSHLYPPMSDKLKEWGLKTYEGYDGSRIKNFDLVIIGNAISRGNPEVEEVLNSGIEYLSMPAAISHFFLKDKKVIVVAGTHGKTTTTFLIHHILKEIGESPGLFVGGIRKDGFPGFEIGNGEYFVIEGDEYDSSFFDKSSKFLHYRPYHLILNALDFDHADIFNNIEDIKVMFQRLLNLTPKKGSISYYDKSKNLKEICSKFPHVKTEGFNINTKSSLIKIVKGKPVFSNEKLKLDTDIIGEHNFRNLEVSLKLLFKLFPNKQNEIIHSVSTFPGVKRRQDILYTNSNSILMEDFAHHPVAIEETIKAVKMAYPNYEIISLFEPRSATSHRKVFQKEFSMSFKRSRAVFLTEVFNKSKVAPANRLDVKKLVKDTLRNSKVINSFYNKNPEEIIKNLSKYIDTLKSDKIVILAMSNGSFGGIYPSLKNILEKRN